MNGRVTELRPRHDALVEAHRGFRRHQNTDTVLTHLSDVDREARREVRLDRIQAGKTTLWRINLRLSQLANGIILCLAAIFMVWQDWAWWATGLAAVFTVTGMWTCARWMNPRELRLCRHMACLARRRRTCAQCGYRLHDLVNHQCPECGLSFAPNDTRHVLTRETVRLYSARARMVSTVVIVCVLFWVSALAQGESWPVNVGLALASLAAFYGLHLFWKYQAGTDMGRSESEMEMHEPGGFPQRFRCPDCNRNLGSVQGGASTICPGCDRRLTYGDIFIRPDVRRLSDRRITSLQFQSLILRWIFLFFVCGGLTTFVYLQDTMLSFAAPLGQSRSTLLVTLGLPVLAWVAISTFLFRHLAAKLQRRLRLLFTQIHPACSRCHTDVSKQQISQPCPACGHRISSMVIFG